MKFSAMHYTLGAALLIAALGDGPALAQDAPAPYPKLAPIEQYLMDRDAEIALARSAAPASISKDATVLVLGRHGYETAATGTNGFVCMVARGWVGALDWPEAFNPKTRGAECLNPQAARSIVPLAEIRTEMFFAGRSRSEIIARIKDALRQGESPALEPGAMSYMMGRNSYLTDQGNHNMPHVMFYVPDADDAAWGAKMAGSPVGSGPYWSFYDKTDGDFAGLPIIHVFTVMVGQWSDGTPASAHDHHM